MIAEQIQVEIQETLDEYIERNKQWLEKALKQADNGEFHILTEEELLNF
ncbi:MAG: hypothetical protein LBN97_08005 [Oscillospiraceae bacterium]|jgi:hypothetical protein|nr:hypothetical protein [Oscillospiraceae bacterium]